MSTLKPQISGSLGLYSNTVIGNCLLAVTFGTAKRDLDGLRPIAVPNVTAHPSTSASVPTSYYSMRHCNNLCSLKG